MASLIDILVRMRGARAVQLQAGQTAAAIQGIGAAAQTSAAQTTAASTKTAAQTKKMQRAGQVAFSRVGRQAKLLTIGMGVLGGVAYVEAANFQQSLNIFQAVSNASGEAMKEASAKAVQLGADVRLPGVTAASAADTMLLLAKAGFEAADAVDATRGALLLSQAANMDAEESTTILARTLKAFNLDPAKNAVKVVDALAAAELKTTVTMREIADGMTYASASAHQMGVDVVDTTTALGILNDAGISGTKAGTSLNQMFVRMSSPTKKAKEGLQALRLWTKRGTSAFFDQRGEFVGFRKASDLLSSSMKGLNRQQKLHYMYMIFGREGQRAADRILSRGTDRWDEYREAIGKSGQAQKYVNARMKGSKAAIESMKNAWQTFLVVFGAAISPVLDPVVRWLGRMFAWLTQYPKQTAIVTGVIFGLAGSLWALSTALKVGRTVKETYQGYKLAAKAAKEWSVMQWLLNTSLWGFPVLLIIAAVIALGIGFYIMYKKVGWFRDAVNKTWDWIKQHWPLLLAILLGPFAVAGYFIFKYRDQVKAALLSAYNWVKQNWPLLVAVLFGPFALAAYAIYRFRDTIRSAIGGAVDWVKQKFNSLVDFFKSLPSRLAGALAGKAGNLLSRAVSAGQKYNVIPEFATGGVMRRSGMALVGEQGPELIGLPGGARVTPLVQALAMGGGGGVTAATIPVQVVLDRRVVGEATARWFADKKARA